ncbi:MAG: hypothetical protein FJ295_18960 [Planctomycetes bacterium]|nr:hypothetical protein [Planctomycetota bacterium]
MLRFLIAGLILGVTVLGGGPLRAELRIKHICRLKGQEENTLQGIGIVVGLKGTGDSEAAPSAASWVPLDATNTTLATTKLKNLVDALNALKAPSEDVIEIIKSHEASGHLYGQVVIE